MRFRYFSVSGASTDYDDNVTLSRSGSDVWTSGLLQPLSNSKASNDAFLMEQGKVLMDDKKLYVLGTVDTSGTMKIGMGSPVSREYSIVPDGIQAWSIESSIVYKKVYLRFLPNGSLAGE